MTVPFWPDKAKYQEVLQYHDLALSDPGLRVCVVEKHPSLGFPMTYSGAFTTTYHLIGQDQEWAVRCFNREVPPDLEVRYRYFGDFFTILNETARSYFVEARYQFPGVKVDTVSYPVIKMEWVRGKNLDVAIREWMEAPGDRPPADEFFSRLKVNFLDLVNTLQITGLAHGDLQHGNIRVDDQGRLHLIDYDGMFVPALKGATSHEGGHRNYQHIDRRDHFDERLDRFSSIVLYLTFLALETDPGLWDRYNDTERVLFGTQDFIDPGDSPLVRELRGYPGLAPWVDRFVQVCLLEYGEIPTLKEFIAGQVPVPRRSRWETDRKSKTTSSGPVGSGGSRSQGSGTRSDRMETFTTDRANKMVEIYGPPTTKTLSGTGEKSVSGDTQGSGKTSAVTTIIDERNLKLQPVQGIALKQAPLIRELCAEVVDLTFVALGLFIVLAVCTVARVYTPMNNDLSMLVFFNAAFILVYLLYHVLQETTPSGATIGMTIFGIRASSVSGDRMTAGQAAARALIKAVSVLCFGIPFLVMLVPSYRQGFQNLVAHTRVTGPEGR